MNYKERFRIKLFEHYDEPKLDSLVNDCTELLPPTSIDEVKEFMTLFQPEAVAKKPQYDLTDEQKIFRVKLLFEELHELALSLGVNEAFAVMCGAACADYNKTGNKGEFDMIEAADALGDLQYVLDGAFITLGLKEAKDDICSEVHRSNMTKACRNDIEAHLTIQKYGYDGIKSYAQPTIDISEPIIVRRSSDNKVLKSVHYSPANLEPIINALD